MMLQTCECSLCGLTIGNSSIAHFGAHVVPRLLPCCPPQAGGQHQQKAILESMKKPLSSVSAPVTCASYSARTSHTHASLYGQVLQVTAYITCREHRCPCHKNSDFHSIDNLTFFSCSRKVSSDNCKGGWQSTKKEKNSFKAVLTILSAFTGGRNGRQECGRLD